MENKELDQLILQIPHDDSAFDNLYEQTKTIVFAYIMSIVKNYDESSDILQEVYIKIFLAAKNYSSMKKPLAWIYTIARNECYMHLRRKKINQEYDDNLSIPQNIDMDSQMILQQLFEVLNDIERQVIIMHSLWGFKHHEIASYLDIPISTSLSHYRRGMKKLKKAGGDMYDKII
ncbi:MAG: RNA polymerase sigma factor [Erysipelotrichaceae bacterium]|nr:RNA polymerase sigma factor [Erysipelotrichaceae bacterium]